MQIVFCVVAYHHPLSYPMLDIYARTSSTSMGGEGAIGVMMVMATPASKSLLAVSLSLHFDPPLLSRSLARLPAHVYCP